MQSYASEISSLPIDLSNFSNISMCDMIFAHVLKLLQGKNADSLAMYFGEDPARCPFEQGTFSRCIY